MDDPEARRPNQARAFLTVGMGRGKVFHWREDRALRVLSGLQILTLIQILILFVLFTARAARLRVAD